MNPSRVSPPLYSGILSFMPSFERFIGLSSLETLTVVASWTISRIISSVLSIDLSFKDEILGWRFSPGGSNRRRLGLGLLCTGGRSSGRPEESLDDDDCGCVVGTGIVVSVPWKRTSRFSAIAALTSLLTAV